MSNKNHDAHQEEHQEKLYAYVNKHYWGNYNSNTTILSSTCRQLALGEGGICWAILSSGYSKITQLEINLILIFLVLFFLFDAAQYLFSSEAYKNLASNYDRQIKDKVIERQSQLELPPGINIPSRICFMIKLFILMTTSLVFIFFIFLCHS